MSASVLPIPHPHMEALRLELRSLRDQLAALIDEEEVLRRRVGPYLQSLYDSRLGPLEFELMTLRVDNAALRRRTELLQARVNHGQRVTRSLVADIDARVRDELDGWHAQVEQREREVREAAEHDRLYSALSPTLQRKAKTLYRDLAKRLHPDVVGSTSPSFERYWGEVARAYAEVDVHVLEAILAVLDGEKDGDAIRLDESASGALGRLEAERDRLRLCVERQMDRLVELRRSPPYCYERELSDSTWITGKRAELRKAIAVANEQRQALEFDYERLVGSDAGEGAGAEVGVGEKSRMLH